MQLHRDGVALIAAAVVTLGMCTAALSMDLALPGAKIARTSSAQIAQASTGRMELLLGYDMPFHDYRSSLNDPRLAHGGLDDCMKACLGDAGCMAFTYNSKAKACFLKDSATTPVAYPGVTSGRKSMGGSDAEPMSIDDVRGLQSGLSRLGLLMGTPDGIAGPATYRAIAAFRATYGYASNSVDHDLLDAVTRTAFGGQSADQPTATADIAPAIPADDGAATVAATTEAKASPFPASDAVTPPVLPLTSDYRSLDDVGEALALLALAYNSTLLDDTPLAKTWFYHDNPDRNVGGTELGHRYSKANAIERESIIRTWRAQKIAEAKAFAAAKDSLPLHLFVDKAVRLGTYQPGSGLLMEGGFSSKVLAGDIDLLLARFTGSLLDLPDLKSVPANSQKAASALLDRARIDDGRSLVMRLYLTLTEVGADRNLDGVSPGGTSDIAVTLHLDRATLEKVPALASRRADDHAPPLAVLYDSSSAAAATPPADVGNSVRDVARRLGIPLRDGRLLLAGDQNADGVVEAFGYKWDYQQPRPLTRLLDLMSLRLLPSRDIDFDRLGTIAAELMDQRQRIRVFGSNTSFARDEFARRKALEMFKSQVLPELVATAPGLPMKVTTVVAAGLGEYDFERHGFPIHYDSRTRPFPTPSSFRDNGQPWQIDLDFYDLPDFLPMDEQQAESRMHERRDLRGRRVAGIYLAASGTLDRDGPDSDLLVFKPDSLTLFIDPELRQVVLDIDPATHMLTAEQIKQAEAAKHAPVLTGDAPQLAQMQPMAGANLFAAIGARLSPEARREFAGTNIKVDRADEFHRADATAAALDILEATPPETLWFSGTLELGAYDSAAAAFPVAAWHFDSFDPGDTGFAVDFNSTIADRRFLRQLPIDATTAQAIVEQHNRKVRIKASVSVASAELDKKDHLNVVFDIGRLVAWIGSSNGHDATIVADIDRAKVEAGWHVDLDKVDGPRKLDADSLDYLWLATAPQAPSDDQLMRMMLARWMIDSHDKDRPADQRFFEFGEPMPGAILRDRLLPLFRSWATARAAHRPDRMMLPVFHNDLDCGTDLNAFRQSGAAFAPFAAAAPASANGRTYAEDVTSYRTPFVGGPYFFVHIGHPLQQHYCQFHDENDVLSKALGGAPDAVSPAMIEIDNLYSYPGSKIDSNQPSTIEVAIERIDLLPGNGRRPPPMLIRTRFIAAHFAGRPDPLPDLTREALEQQLAEQNKVVSGPDWDILGMTLAMPATDIDAAIRKHMKVGQVWARDPSPDDGDGSAFRRQRIYVSEDGQEIFVLALGPGGERVSAIARHIFRRSPVPADSFTAALRQKYGRESNAFFVSSLNYGMLWQSRNQPEQPGDRPNAPCRVLRLASNPANVRALEPEGAPPTDILLRYLQPLDSATARQAAQECGTTVSAGFDDGSITTILGDFSAAERLANEEADTPAAPVSASKPPALGFDL